MGVSFFLGDTPHASKQMILKSPIMQKQICQDHCQAYGVCKMFDQCPKFTQQTMYIINYLINQPQMGNTVYPYKGTWQDQPQWYIKAFTMARNKQIEMDKKKYGKS